MLKKSLRFLFLILIFPVLLTIPAYARNELALPIHDYVNDYADVMDPSSVEELDRIGRAFYEKTGVQAVIVTTDSLNGKDAMQVATDTANEAQIGSKDKDNGVLILVSIDDKQRFMAVGSGLEGDLTDIDCEHLQQEYLVPAFRQGNYQQGLVDLYKATLQHIANDYGVDLSSEGIEAPENRTPERQSDSFSLSSLIPIVFVLLIGIVFLTRGSSKKGSALTLYVGQKYRLTTPGYDFDSGSIIVSSSDPNVASIRPDGIIHAFSKGYTIITLQKLDGESTKIQVQVIYRSHSGGRREDDALDAFILGNMLGRASRRSNRYGGFGGFGSGGGFSGGGGGFRGGGSGGSW